MPKLVLLSSGMTGRAFDLKVDKTTIGRVEDNAFQIAEPSVSSHHCEVVMQGANILIRDLNSTNGTFINGEKVTEAVLKPGQTLRLGQIEMRLETDAAPTPSARKPAEQSLTMQRGINLSELEQGARTAVFDTKGTGFTKKQSGGNRLFIIVGIILGVVILVLLLYAFNATKSGK